MEHHAGIEVSQELSSVCIVDATGRIIPEKVASEPEALITWFGGLGRELERNPTPLDRRGFPNRL